MNKLGINLTNKYVILNKKYYRGETVLERLFLCKGGFGTSEATMGTSIFGDLIMLGEGIKIDGLEISRLADEKEMELGIKVLKEREDIKIRNKLGE